jgi:sigma-E factor negative regulatory protein RseC
VIEASARVVAVDGDRARVAVERQTACGSCAAKGGCGTRLISDWLPQRQLSFELDNQIGARPGDRVIVGLDESRMQRYALQLYAIPLAGLLLGAVGGHQFFAYQGWPAEPGSMLLGLLGVAAALHWVWRRGRRMKTRDSGIRLLGHTQSDSRPSLLPPATGSCDAYRGRG